MLIYCEQSLGKFSIYYNNIIIKYINLSVYNIYLLDLRNTQASFTALAFVLASFLSYCPLDTKSVCLPPINI